ncbi:MAG: GNVR domain-containing protein, partial [Bacteroidota bacterium]
MKNHPEELSVFQSVPPSGSQFTGGIEIDYASYGRRLLRNWYWFVLALVVAVGYAWVHLQQTTPLYKAEIRLLVEEQARSGAGGSGLSKDVIAAELGFETSYDITNELEIIRSRQLMERVVKNLGLDVRYVHLGEWREAEEYRPEQFRLFPVDLDTFMVSNKATVEYGSVEVIPAPGGFQLIGEDQDTAKMFYGQAFSIGSREYKLRRLTADMTAENKVYRIEVQDPAKVAIRYRDALDVDQEDRSSVVKMSLADADPHKARDILDQLVDVYGRQIVEQQSRTGQQTLEFLEERLAFVTRQLNAVESSATNYRTTQGLGVDLATKGEDYLAQINNADAKLAELQVRRDLIENLRNNLLLDTTSIRPLPVATEVTSGVLGDLIAQYNDIIFERENKAENITEAHPDLATPGEKLSNLRQSILLSINTNLNETSERAERVKARIRPLEQRMNSIPENQRKLAQIMRQVDIKRNLFIFLMQKREEAALSIAAQVPNTRVIDQALASSYPFTPNPKMIYLLAIGLALFVPGSTLLVREIAGSRLEVEKEIHRATTAPIVGR